MSLSTANATPLVTRGLAGLVLLLAACSSPSSGGQTVSGTISLPESSMIEVLDEIDADTFGCQGAGDFDQLVVGSQVIARDGDNNVVGTGEVSQGETRAEQAGPASRHEAILPCVMPFSVDVGDAEFYTFDIAGWPIEVVYSREDLEGRDWTLELGPAD